MKSQCSCCELQQSWLQGLYPVYSIASLVQMYRRACVALAIPSERPMAAESV